MAISINESVRDMKGYPDGRIANNNAYWNIGANPNFEQAGTTSATLGMGTMHRGDSYNGGSFWTAASQYRDGDWWTMIVPWHVSQEEQDRNTGARLHTATNCAIEYRRVVCYVQLLSDNKWYKVYDGVTSAHAFFRATETNQSYVAGGISIGTGPGGGPLVPWVNDPTNSNTKYSIHQVANQSPGLFGNELGNLVSSSEGGRIQIYFSYDSGQKFKNIFYGTEVRLALADPNGIDDLDNARILGYQGADAHPDTISTYSGPNSDGRPPYAHSRNKRLTREFQWFTAWCCNECNSNNFNTAQAGVSEEYFRANPPPIFFEEPDTTPDPDPDTGTTELTIGKWYAVEDGDSDPYFSKAGEPIVSSLTLEPSTQITLSPSTSQQFFYTISGDNLVASPPAIWSLSDTTNATIDSTSGLLTTNSSFTGELNSAGFYVTDVIITSQDVPTVRTRKTIRLQPPISGTKKVKVTNLEPGSAGETGIKVSVFYSDSSDLTGDKICDVNSVSISSTLEDGYAVMYIESAEISELAAGTSVVVVAENQTQTRGIRGVAAGTVVVA